MRKKSLNNNGNIQVNKDAYKILHIFKFRVKEAILKQRVTGLPRAGYKRLKQVSNPVKPGFNQHDMHLLPTIQLKTIFHSVYSIAN